MEVNCTSNSTNCQMRYDEWYYYNTPHFDPAYDTCLIILAIAIILANSLVIYLFHKKNYLKTESNCILFSLALSDCLTGMVLIPLNISCDSTHHNELCIFTAILTRFIYISSVLHIFATTMEKYICVMHPLKHRTIITKRRVLFIIAFVWIMSGFLSIIQLSWLPISDLDITEEAAEEERRHEIAYASILLVFVFAFPFFCMIYCDVKMFFEIKRQVRDIRLQRKVQNGHGFHQADEKRCLNQRTRQLKVEYRAVVIFFMMLFVFVLLWMPYQYLYFVYYTNEGEPYPWGDIRLGEVFDFLKLFSSLLNPLLYTFLKKDYRYAFSAVFVKRRSTASDLSGTWSTNLLQ